jgi:ABC-2 type transport system ATP-binding protein
VTILVTTHYMDEAEYCERVGVMRDGKLLAMDTPTNLKRSIIKGDVWEVYVQPLERGMELLSAMQGVDRVGLAGDHLRVISSQVKKGAMQSLLSRDSLNVEKIERGEPTLEDVFLALAR